MARWMILVTLVLFTGYTLECCRRENFFQSVRAILCLRWGRQVGADLYIGLVLALLFIYLREESVWVALAWTLPTLVLGNLTVLVYVLTHFEAIVQRFA